MITATNQALDHLVENTSILGTTLIKVQLELKSTATNKGVARVSMATSVSSIKGIWRGRATQVLWLRTKSISVMTTTNIMTTSCLASDVSTKRPISSMIKLPMVFLEWA